MLQNIYSQEITILNKLKREHTRNKLEEWYKTKLNNAAWYNSSERTVDTNGVAISSYYKVLIPMNSSYLDYSDWRENAAACFTLSVGDYIVLGNLTENITPNNLLAILKMYDNVCQVKSITKVHSRGGAKVKLKVEGV